MSKMKFGDVVERVNYKVDKDNTHLEYYVGGEHFATNEVTLIEKGIIKGSTIGPMFYFGFKAGDILFVTRNPHLKKSALVDFDGVCSEKTFVLKTKDESILLQSYLAFHMQTDEFWRYMNENKSGSVNYFINWSTLAKYEFDLPDIEEQERLAKILWAAEDLKRKYNIAINNLRLKLNSYIEVQCFSETYDTKKIIELVKFTTKKLIDGDWIESKNQSDNGIRLLQLSDIGCGVFLDKSRKYINEETFQKLNCFEVLPGDILMSRMADPIGRSCIVEDVGLKMITAVDCCIIRLDNITQNTKYWNYVFNSMKWYSKVLALSSGTTRIRVSRKSLEDMKVPVPHYDIQVKICKELDIISSTSELLNKNCSLISDLQKKIINNPKED